MIDTIKVIDAIKVINPNASVVVYGDTDSVLTCTILWHDVTEEISREDRLQEIWTFLVKKGMPRFAANVEAEIELKREEHVLSLLYPNEKGE